MGCSDVKQQHEHILCSRSREETKEKTYSTEFVQDSGLGQRLWDHTATDLPSQLPSQGSTAHDAGTCKPCLFAFLAPGCSKGYDCEFCHFYHTRHSKTRASKSKRARYRMLAERLTAAGEHD